MLKIGILGCGKIAQVRHIPEYASNPNCELVGFFNPTKSRAEDMAAKYGGKAYDSAEELLANPEIDAVSVCAANNAHAELTIKALKAGKHVLCEKPMAISLADCEEMVKVAHEEGKLLMIGDDRRGRDRQGHHLPHLLRPRRPRDLEHHPGQEHMVL